MAAVKSIAQLESLFLALADKTRLRILNLIGRDEICVGHLVEVLGESQPKVSRHLAYLKASGVVSDRRYGLWKYYSLTRSEGKFHRKLIHCLKSCFDEVHALRQDQARLTQQRKANCRY